MSAQQVTPTAGDKPRLELNLYKLSFCHEALARLLLNRDKPTCALVFCRILGGRPRQSPIPGNTQLYCLLSCLVARLMKEAILVFLVALVVGAAINGFTGAGNNAVPSPQERPQAPQASPGDTAISETSDLSWDTDVLQATTPVLVEFYGESCAECKAMTPVVDKLAADYSGKIKFCMLDAEKNSATAARYNVQGIPTFVVFKGGKSQGLYSGQVPYEDLKQALDKALD
jgi:thioredoxin 1